MEIVKGSGCLDVLFISVEIKVWNNQDESVVADFKISKRIYKLTSFEEVVWPNGESVKQRGLFLLEYLSKTNNVLYVKYPHNLNEASMCANSQAECVPYPYSQMTPYSFLYSAQVKLKDLGVRCHLNFAEDIRQAALNSISVEKMLERSNRGKVYVVGSYLGPSDASSESIKINLNPGISLSLSSDAYTFENNSFKASTALTRSLREFLLEVEQSTEVVQSNIDITAETLRLLLGDNERCRDLLPLSNAEFLSGLLERLNSESLSPAQLLAAMPRNQHRFSRFWNALSTFLVTYVSVGLLLFLRGTRLLYEYARVALTFFFNNQLTTTAIYCSLCLIGAYYRGTLTLALGTVMAGFFLSCVLVVVAQSYFGTNLFLLGVAQLPQVYPESLPIKNLLMFIQPHYEQSRDVKLNEIQSFVESQRITPSLLQTLAMHILITIPSISQNWSTNVQARRRKLVTDSGKIVDRVLQDPLLSREIFELVGANAGTDADTDIQKLQLLETLANQ